MRAAGPGCGSACTEPSNERARARARTDAREAFVPNALPIRQTHRITGRSYTAREKVSGDADGVTEVRSTGTLGEDGVHRTVSQYLQNAGWKPGGSELDPQDAHR